MQRKDGNSHSKSYSKRYGKTMADIRTRTTPLYTNRAGGNLRKGEASAKLRERERISERSRSVVLPPVNEDYGWPKRRAVEKVPPVWKERRGAASTAYTGLGQSRAQAESGI